MNTYTQIALLLVLSLPLLGLSVYLLKRVLSDINADARKVYADAHAEAVIKWHMHEARRTAPYPLGWDDWDEALYACEVMTATRNRAL